MLKLFSCLRQFKVALIVSLVLVMLRALLDLYLPRLTADIVNVGIMTGDTAYILRVGGIMLAIAAGGGVSAVVASFYSARASTGFARVLREKVFSRVEAFSLSEFDKFGTASLITRTTNDITQVQNVLMMILRMLVMAPIMSIGGIFMAVSTDPALSVVFVFAIPLIFLIVTFIGRKGIPLFQAVQIKLDTLNLVLRERLTGIRVTRAFNREDYERERFEDANYDYTSTAIRVFRIMAFVMPFMMMVMNLTTISIIWFGGIRIDLGYILVGDLMAFIQYAAIILSSMVALSMLFVMIPRAAVSAQRINEVLESEPQITDAKNVEKADKARGFVEFDDVTFSYPGAERPALCNITFSACPGEVTAIIGGTGSGKSTVSSLLLRFYDVHGGSIRVNGVDIRKMAQKELRTKIGYVPQRAVLFSGSVEHNIRYGKIDAKDDEVRHAAEIAQASDFIMEMPQGFQAVIAQEGLNVSGGQKQRLSIARALVKKPEIYIFDDSFSALDYKTDARLRAALKEETADSTVIIITQRISTVLDAHRIIVLENGKVAGIGTHNELLHKSGIYREIVSSQLSEEEIA